MATDHHTGSRTRYLAVSLLSAAFAACGLEAIGNVRENNPLPVDAADVEEDVPVTDSDADVDAEAGIVDAGPCSVFTRGPKMILGADGGVCVDVTEVTNGDYDLFLNATDGGLVDAGIPDGGLAPGCAGLLSYDRLAPSGAAAQPVAQITWCAAEAYCRWAGKRLCRGTHNVFDEGEWYSLCSANGTRTYPYGNDYDATACNDTSGATEPVGSRTGCEGGVPGLFDMTGNVQEFIDACNPTRDSCMGLGGGATGGAANTCSTGGYYAPSVSANATTGFRCCADIP